MSHTKDKSRVLPGRARYFVVAVAIILAAAATFYGAHRYGRLISAEPTQTILSIPAEIQGAFFDDFSNVRRPEKHTVFPAFSYVNTKGEEQQFTVEKGTFVLLNVWASWCPPCLIELPDLEKLQGVLPENTTVKIMAISADQRMEQADVAEFLKKRGLWAEAANQDKAGVIMRNAPIVGLPSSFLLAEGGEILYIFDGAAPWTSREALAFFNAFPFQR